MIECYDAKPWLRIGVGYRAGRLTRNEWGTVGAKKRSDRPQRVVLQDWLASDDGYAECLCCPEIGEKYFRRRHTLAAFIRAHRHCGKRGVRVRRRANRASAVRGEAR